MKKLLGIIGILIVIFIACSYFLQDNPSKTEETQKSTEVISNTNSPFAVHFIDVGKGDAISITCDGKTMLVDGGKEEHASDVTDYLQSLKITQIDYLVNTHPHDDHIGGFVSVVEQFTIGQAFSNVTTYDSTAFNNYVNSLNSKGISLTIPQVGSSINLGSATVQFIGPINQYANENSESLVLRIVYGNTSFLLMGDSQVDSQIDLINSGVSLESTVIKVAHHGSSSANSDEFLQKVKPQYAVISVGDSYQYSILSEDTLDSLDAIGADVYRTDLHGNIVCTSDGKSVTFSTEKSTQSQEE